MKKALLALAAVALLFATSCKKESINPAIDVPEGSFLATIDNGANPQNAPVVKDGMGTMTTIDANRYVIWENGDEISINGSIYTTDASGSSVIFSGEGATGTTFHAFFPASIAGTDAAGTLPATQTIELDGNNNITVRNLPMYATSNNNQLTFHNICAALKIVIPSFLNGATSIEVSCSDKAMNGAFTVTDNAAVMTATTPTDAEKKVTIAKASGTFATGDTVYIAVPANTYSNLKVEAFNNTTSMWNKTLATCTLNVNKVYNVNITPMGVCFTALQNGCTVNFSDRSLFDYYDENDDTWKSWKNNHDSEFTLNNGQKLYLRGHTILLNLNLESFILGGNMKVSGNIMYLLDPTGTSTTLGTSAFEGLFLGCDGLLYAGDLLLPATILANACYKMMFDGCQNLLTAPQLPAETLAISCYEQMFSGCLYLVNAPQLPATIMANNCYRKMFSNCSELRNAPQLLAPTLADYCYSEMFNSCGLIKTVTMKATNVSAPGCLDGWLNSTSDCATLTVVNNPSTAVTGWSYVLNNTPAEWTIKSEDGTVIRNPEE